ncbi:hypothetical protein [Clostridium porci]|uniref:hypothetical protein n=1 Tax=Clostridium porci TaxID=2605778 RepID=UPI003A92E4AE
MVQTEGNILTLKATFQIMGKCIESDPFTHTAKNTVPAAIKKLHETVFLFGVTT